MDAATKLPGHSPPLAHTRRLLGMITRSSTSHEACADAKPGRHFAIILAIIDLCPACLASLNLSHFVARKIWRRCGVSPRYCRAHRLQRRAPLYGLLMPMDTIFDLTFRTPRMATRDFSRGIFRTHNLPPTGCDRAIPSPNRLTERFAYKIKRLPKNVALLYSPGSHANELDADP